jgi:hypothetical protein
MKADHLCGFNFRAYINFENTKQTNKTLLSRFPVCLELRMNYTPLRWYEQEQELIGSYVSMRGKELGRPYRL